MTDMPTVSESRLASATRKLLQQRPRSLTYPIICADTGLTESWLTTFVSGSERDFGVNKVELLYTYLTGKQLDL